MFRKHLCQVQGHQDKREKIPVMRFTVQGEISESLKTVRNKSKH